MSYPKHQMRGKPHLYRVGPGWLCVGRMCEAGGRTACEAFNAWLIYATLNAKPGDSPVPGTAP